MRLHAQVLRWLTLGVAAALLTFIVPGPYAPPEADAAVTFTVNDSGDDPDLIAGDGNCDTTLFLGTCTLRRLSKS